MLYEDDHLLVVSKPVGLPVHGGAKTDRTLLDVLASAYSAPPDLGLIHRLDRATSGAIAVAKSRDVISAITDRWEEATKIYLAICYGTPTDPSVIDVPLMDKERGRRPARTTLRPLALLDRLELKASLVAIEIDTGRMHQIRRHLASIGFPVLFDDRHGDYRANRAFRQSVRDAGAKASRRGQLLHATLLSLPHPIEKRTISVTAPIPSTWIDIIGVAGDAEQVAESLDRANLPLAMGQR